MLRHVSVHSGAFCLRHRVRDPISVAFSDRVALFSVFNQLFELLDQVLLPIAVAPFYILELCSKNILKTLTANCMNNFHVGNVCFPYKALEQKASFSCFSRDKRRRTPLFSGFSRVCREIESQLVRRMQRY